MEIKVISHPSIKLAGITIRASNSMEKDYTQGQILALIQKYFATTKLLALKQPRITYCAYTDYESDFTGDYTYFIGEEITAFEKLPEGFSTLIIPEQTYVRFTNGPGAMPTVRTDVWNKVWALTQTDFKMQFGGERSYSVDFEVYDERSTDHNNITFDVFIGITK